MPNSLRARIKKLWYQGHLSREDCDRIRDALEKQIPKKPIEKADNYFDDGKCYYCPTCGDSLATNSDDTYYNWWLNHCDKCGQKIDYSEVKDD